MLVFLEANCSNDIDSSVTVNFFFSGPFFFF